MDRIKKNWKPLSLFAIYIVGITGFILEGVRDQFASLIWATLLISFLFLLSDQRSNHRNFFVSMFLVAFGGYLVEVIGVRTGLLFGNYEYGSALGLKVMDTPLMIGINWAMLVCVSSYAARKITQNKIGISLLGAAMMTALDLLIEPFAIYFDLWSWEGDIIPWQNYAMWFVVSYFLQRIFQRLNPELENGTALTLGVWLVVFFVAVNMVIAGM